MDASAELKAAGAPFHKKFYEEFGYGNGRGISWLGVGALKHPCDLWVYQELIYKIQPDLVIETGTHMGGSAFYLASIMDLINKGTVISIDISHGMLQAQHPRVTFIRGPSLEPSIVKDVTHTAEGCGSVMAILDSDHRRDHVYGEMDAYAPLVSVGSYLIVEDTNLGGNPVSPSFGPGPAEAVADWLPKHPEFEVDADCERFGITFNPGGYLKRIG